MTALQHTHLEGIAEYADALDTVCRQAKHDLYLFEKNDQDFSPAVDTYSLRSKIRDRLVSPFAKFGN